MITLLLGPDDFSKKEYIKSLISKTQAEVESFSGGDTPSVQHFSEQDLFSKEKIFVVNGLIAKVDLSNIDALIKRKNHIVFVEEKLDKRSTANKNLLANKSITIKEFSLPHGKEVNKWISDRVKFYNGDISVKAIEELAKQIGRDEAKETKFGGKVVNVQEMFNLWQLDSEIQKLVGLALGREITEEDVLNIVSHESEIDVFEIINAIGENNAKKALSLLHGFLSAQTGSDEKGGVIQLNALLAEQFRNVIVVQDFVIRQVPEAGILEATGWKSGRLFVMKKIAQKFKPQKVLELLSKLEFLDLELKTSSTPPRVLLDLIAVQLLG